jgi:hypothetical protein
MHEIIKVSVRIASFFAIALASSGAAESGHGPTHFMRYALVRDQISERITQRLGSD